MGPIYVAFDGDNDKWAYGFMKGWKTNDRVDFDFKDAHELDTMTARAQGEAYVKSHLKERMKASDALIVIVGDKTKNLFKFVPWEIEFALELGLPIIVTNLNNTNGKDAAFCPPILRDACAAHIPFKKDAIKHALANWPAEFRRLDAAEKAKGARHYNRQWA
jgi:hypothetical protein